MQDKSVDERLQLLESKFSYQEMTIDALDEQVQKLNTLVESMQLYCRALEQRIAEFQVNEAKDAAVYQDVPPHY